MNRDQLYEKLKQDPVFLFLGQNYLRLETERDPFLAEILRKYGPHSEANPGYMQIFSGTAGNSIEQSLIWMQERCTHLPCPVWLKTVAAFPWSGIYTSAIDTIWRQAFQTEWRELEPIFEERYRPIDLRNRFRLHCTYLFGCVDQAENNKRPPLTLYEWLERKQVAVEIARRLPEVLTPFGVLLIEGYAADKDWFKIEDLLPIINNLNSGQAHLFSATAEIRNNPYIAHLVGQNKLLLYEEGLAHFLHKGQELGILDLGKKPGEDYGHNLSIEDRRVSVPPKIWRRVSRSAAIMEESMFPPVEEKSPETRYELYRNFLSQSNAKAQWQGYVAGFNFLRDFEDELYKKVHSHLKSREQQTEPIILHGQTGTGKTIALQALAYKVFKERKHPVLFIERRSQRPSDFNADIEAFCEWAENEQVDIIPDENKSITSTLIIWDGMVELERYYELQQHLNGRGRKAVVVGSHYFIDTGSINPHNPRLIRRTRNFIEATPSLSIGENGEVSRLTGYLKSIDPALNKMNQLFSQLLQEQEDTTFLVALYRLLPATHRQLQAGVSNEVIFTEQELRRQIRTVQPDAGTMAYALCKAGLITPEELINSPEPRDIGDEKMDDLQELIGLIMVPGRFGLKVPIDLLLRALGKAMILDFVNLLKRIDLFRWEDQIGNISIGPRNALEARIIVSSRLGAAQTEIAFVRQLLLAVKDSNDFLENPEVQFAVDLIRSIGPNNEQEYAYFAPHFQALADVLTTLREKYNVQHARLMLQEASLLREAVKWRSRPGQTLPDADALLEKAEAVLHLALEHLQKEGRATNQFSGFIYVELSSNLGSKNQQLLSSTEPEQAIFFFKEIRHNIFKVLSIDPRNYHAIDVLCWTSRDILKSPALNLDISFRSEVEADLLYIFAVAETEEFDPLQQIRLQQRRQEIGQLLGDNELSEDAFRKLSEKGSCAGYYLKASHIAGRLPTDQPLSEEQGARCQEAVDYLDSVYDVIKHDGRCLNLLLRLWWMSKTGKAIFSSEERQTVAFDLKDWRKCLTVISDIKATGDLYTNPRLEYLHGLAVFHIGSFRNALQIFRDLERESEYQGRRRIVRSYLASNALGNPVKYDGTVYSVEGNKGLVYVPMLRDKIPFFPRDFNRPNIRVNDSLGQFHIAFNFIGPLADPEFFFEQQQKRKGNR